MELVLQIGSLSSRLRSRLGPLVSKPEQKSLFE
jgi:hypothetical protein